MKKITFLFVFSVYSLILLNAQNFQNEHIVSYGDIINPSALMTADVDNDGDLDILYSSLSYPGWLENIDSSYYINHFLFNPDSLMSSNQVAVNDIDNDGNLDVFFGYVGAVARYHINNNGEFEYDGIIDTVSFTPETLAFADFDNDGDKDILVSTSYFDMIWVQMRETEITWIENINSGSEWISHKLYSQLTFGCEYRSAPADIDNDGDIDILSTNCMKDTIYIFENTGDGTFSFSGLSIPDDIKINFFKIIDIDFDGDYDIVASTYIDDKGYYTAMWFENLNGNIFSDIHIIDETDYAYNFLLDDLNNDGYPDIAVNNSLTSIGFYFSDGEGDFELKDTFEDAHCYFWSVSAVDMDYDGDLDVLYCDKYYDKIAWIENELCSGVNEFSDRNGAIFPNPVSETLTINLSGDYIVEIYNSNGGRIFSGKQKTINLSYLRPGIYFVKIVNSDGGLILSEKIIKI